MTTGLDTGTYEVLRDRLAAQAAELARRAEALNARRTEEFGSTELRLAGTERLRTEHNCVPRDIVAVGGVLLFGYNVFLGLKPRDDRRRRLRAARPRPEPAARRRRARPARRPRLRPRVRRALPLLPPGPPAAAPPRRRQAAGRLPDRREGRATSASCAGRVGRRTARRPSSTPAATATTSSRPRTTSSGRATTREDHVLGRHPHVSIEGEVFVATVGGTLTVKVENDTETGEGIYAEPVDEPLQSLADADIAYARVGALILLRIRPYKEDADRHLVFNTLTRTVVRLDGIGQACRRLPEDQGIVFPGGYCLATGTHKTFDADATEAWSSSGRSARPTARTCCTSSTPAPRAAACCCRTT